MLIVYQTMTLNTAQSQFQFKTDNHFKCDFINMNDSMVKQQFGFSLIEIIVVLIVLGIAAAIIGPFLSNILGNYIQSREIAERERQAGLILERFVRDVRMSDGNSLNIHDCTTTQTFYKNNNVTYKQDGFNLIYNDKLLAKQIDNVCFQVQNATSFMLVSISFDLIIDDNMNLSYKASAVPRWN